MTRAIINPLPKFLNSEILPESIHIYSHAQWIYNKQDLIVRKYIDGLEPKSPVNFITIFKFQNWLVGQLAGLPASHYAALLIQEH